MSTLQPIDSALFFSRHDPHDPRLGELCKKKLEQPGVSIVGYADDEGIALNGGRVGAALGPTEIRRWLYRMTPHPRLNQKDFQDLGDVTKDSNSLAARHEAAERAVASALKNGHQVLSLGGGNDYAYADGISFLKQFRSERPLIINVDAHLDVRDTSRGLTSGTPFYRLLESGIAFDFLEFGIQTQCNSRQHWEYVTQKGGRIVTLEELRDSGVDWNETVLRTHGDWFLKPRPAFVAIDMDAFAWPYAMGTSASWPLGLDPLKFWNLLQIWLKRLDVRVMGLYEVSPPLDNGSGTAKLAAQWAHCFLHV